MLRSDAGRLIINSTGLDPALLQALAALADVCRMQGMHPLPSDGEVIVARCKALQKPFQAALQKAEGNVIAASYLQSKLALLEAAIAAIPINRRPFLPYRLN